MLYGEHLSPVKPRTVAITFMTSDFCSLVLQAGGGGIAETATDNGTAQRGINVMISGLLLQAISISVFLSFMVLFGWRSRTGKSRQTPESVDEQTVRAQLSQPLFKMFLVSLLVATVAILVRSVYRVVELWGGFEGDLWNNEKDFMILDGATMALSVLLLSAFHPGIAFGANWSAANWAFKSIVKE